MAVICHAYPEWISDKGKNLTKNQFYHCLLPSLHDAFSFAMADLPEWEQANMRFDTLDMLTKKLEVMWPSHSQKGGSGSADAYRDRFRRYPMPTGRVANLKDEELFPPDSETWDSEPPEFHQIEGLSMQMTKAMNHYQCEEQWCFMCDVTDHFARDTLQNLLHMVQGAFNLQRGMSGKQGTCSKKTHHRSSHTCSSHANYPILITQLVN